MPKFLLTQCRSLDCTFMFHFMRKWERRQTVAFCCTTLQENPVLVPPRPLPRNQKHRKIQIYLEEYLVGNKLFLIVWWAESICGWCFRPSGHINCTIFIQICKWVLIIMFPSLKKECYWFLCVWLTLSVSGQCHPCVFSGFRDSFEPEMDGRHLHILQGLCLPVSFVSPFALIF